MPRPETPELHSETIQGADDPGAGHPRRCVACGYDLFGLGEEPRCPECGLLNIPEGYRQQVWDWVGSGTWFFSGMFNPFRRRPPGWWWALDRDGDLRRSAKFLARYIALTMLLIIGIGTLFGSVLVEVTIDYTFQDVTNPDSPEPGQGQYRVVVGLGGSWVRGHNTMPVTRAMGIATETTSTRVLFGCSRDIIWSTLTFAIWAIFCWAGPAMVGVWTQIRKGLPRFACAPRTIIAASNYEAHRAVYVGVAVVLGLALDAGLRVACYASQRALYSSAAQVLFLAVWMFAVTGWVGPLRSDYTRQLIRSRVHALRILLMYAIVLPPLTVGLVFSVVALLQGTLR